MKKISFLTLGVFLFSCFAVKAQTVDSTAVFSPVLSGTEIVYASVVYNLNESTNRDANFTLSDAEMTAWSNGACIATFGTSGIQARNGGSNASTNTVNFSDGDEIHLWFDLNFYAHTYSLYAENVTVNGPVTLIYQDAAFRTEQNTLGQLSRWNAVHNSSNSNNTLTVKEVKTVEVIGNPAEAEIYSIGVSVGEFTFNPEVFSYNIELPKGTDSVTVTALATQATAMVYGTGQFSVASGTATTMVYATSADGQQNSDEYMLKFAVKVVSEVATLKSITVTLDGKTVNLSGFTPTGYNYTYSLPVDATGIPVVNVVTTDANATVTTLTQATAVPGTATIVVTAEDGVTKATYTIRFIKNLLAGWDGNGATGDLSKPSDFGWTTPYDNFSTANGSSGSRYMDYGNGQYSSGYEYIFNEQNFRSGRLLWLRWSADVYYTLPVKGLESCKTYRFSFKYAWHNNANTPLVKVAINEKTAGVLKMDDTNFQCGDRRILKEGSLTFTTSGDGDEYYLSFGALIAGAAPWGDVMVAITDLVLEEISDPEPEMFLPKSQMIISDLTPVASQSFFVYTTALTEDLVITAPAGFTLTAGTHTGSAITIPTTEATCGVNVKVAVTDKSQNQNAQIVAQSGTTFTDTLNIIYISKDGNNLISLAMGAGADIYGEGTEPSSFGWTGAAYINQDTPKVATWTTAGSGSNRYNTVNNFIMGEDTIPTDWALLLRWDELGNTDSATVFAYPVELQAGKNYVFTGKLAWHSNGYQCAVTINVNSQADNTGDALGGDGYLIGSGSGLYDVSGDIRKWEEATLEFTADNSGVHYLTIYVYPDVISADFAVLAAFKDLSLVCTDCGNAVDNTNMDKVKVFVQDKYIMVDGIENYRVYSVTGAEMDAKARQLDGVYVVSANGNQYKVVVK